MSRRTTQHTIEERLVAVLQYEQGRASASRLARQLGTTTKTIRRWVRHYQSEGTDGLRESHHWKQYSAEVKRAAVKAYLDDQQSLNDVCQAFKISSSSVLRRWINQYTSGRTLRSTGGPTAMKKVKSRKTTLEERLEIVQFTLMHDKNYQLAMKKYQVSYSQVYSWVKKYEQAGRDGLVDRRGKALPQKPEAELTPEEKLRREVGRLKAANEDLALENALLKKLSALERFDR